MAVQQTQVIAEQDQVRLRQDYTDPAAAEVQVTVEYLLPAAAEVQVTESDIIVSFRLPRFSRWRVPGDRS